MRNSLKCKCTEHKDRNCEKIKQDKIDRTKVSDMIPSKLEGMIREANRFSGRVSIAQCVHDTRP